MSETVNTTSGELVTIEDTAAVPVATLAEKISDLQAGGTGGILSTITGTDFESKLAVLSAVNNSLPISEHLNKKIMVKNIIVQPIVMENETTKKMEAQPRVIFVQEDGTAFHAISNVLFRDVNDWFGILGHPSEWAAPLPIVVKQEGTGTRKFFTAKLTK